MTVPSYYYCKHCKEETVLEIHCPCCGFGESSNHSNLFKEFFSWLQVHKAGRENLFKSMRENYDWGYIKACDVIGSELKRLIKEHKDDSDRIAGDQ